ncbi:nucleoporin protein Ndc1-Nup [Whalleya microplaca]|nr:nucleoporin protein Ndc1-Nup [Whalleya microplaca]
MPPGVARLAPYKDFLQPALQRRFASTAGVLFGIAYVEALTLASYTSYIWSWIPIGPTGIRALAIFACILPTIILRIAHSHIGIRTSNSPFDTFRGYVYHLATAETVVTFAVSAWLFSQVYLFSVSESASLQWITHHSGDRPRLNERAVFYTVNLVVLGIVQGILHVSLDNDRMLLGIVKPRREAVEDAPPIDSWERLSEWAPVLVVRAATLSMAVGLFNYVVFYTFFRRYAWSWAMATFRLFYNLPKSNIPPSQAPWSVWMLQRSMLAGFLLCLLWYFGDMTFRLQLGKEPIKNNQPLSAESKDPNGSLLNGLKSKKPRIAAFAMWELAFIARDFVERRQAIFEDIDRKDGPMWSQIYVVCLDTIRTLEQRVDNYGRPPAPPAPPQPAEAQPQPQRVAKAPRTDDVLIPVPAQRGLRNSVGKFVNRAITSPGKAPADIYVPEAKKALELTREHLLTREQSEALTPDGFSALFQNFAWQVLQRPIIGPFFHHLFGRRLATVVLGTPYGELSIYVNAAYALSQLAVCSLTEDRYGNVQRDVPAIIRTFTVVIKKLERFRDGFPMHWTDLARERLCPEVEKLLDALKDGLNDLITAFGPYATDLRLTRADMRLAREAAVKPHPEPEAQPQPQPQRAAAPAPAPGGPVEEQPEMRQVR